MLISCYTVPPGITTTPGDLVFYTGDTHTLECGATGFPAPVISYYFNATLITTGVSDGVLTFTSVTATNTGPYQCFADNVRADSSALWVVTVRDPSECCIQLCKHCVEFAEKIYILSFSDQYYS